jgi:hypothetical protein
MTYEISRRDTEWGDRIVVHSHDAINNHVFYVFENQDGELVLVGKASVGETDFFGGDIPPEVRTALEGEGHTISENVTIRD